MSYNILKLVGFQNILSKGQDPDENNILKQGRLFPQYRPGVTEYRGSQGTQMEKRGDEMGWGVFDVEKM